MVRPKNQTKKQPKKQIKKQPTRGVDFKKFKKKIGRKLPPPNNATNLEIKSKAIILPEQSLASDKAGLATSKKGLTLKELLQQTSHYNSKVRKDALIGIKDLVHNHPGELRLHKSAVIEKLRERIGDDDKVVREALYQLLKSTIFPGFIEDNQASLISLMMAYIFNAMTHLAIDVRLMAFKIFDLIVQFYPPSFLLNAEKILQNYENILRNNHFYLEDKGKLKIILTGLVRCLSLLPCDRKDLDKCEKDIVQQGVLHAFESDMPREPAGFADTVIRLKDLMPVLVNCFQEFSPLVQNMAVMDAQAFDCMLCVLNGIDLAVKFFLYWTDRCHSEIQLPRSDTKTTALAMHDQTIVPVSLRKLLMAFPLNPMHNLSVKDDDKYFILNIVIAEIFLQLRERICPPAFLLDKFLEFLGQALSGEIGNGTRGCKAFCEKHVLSLLPFIPKLVSQLDSNWKSSLLQAFTHAFKDCRPESAMKLACLSTVEEILIPNNDRPYIDASDPAILTHMITWIRELPLLLLQLGDKHPLSSQAVLHLQLFLGKHALMNSALAQEYNDMQYLLTKFYSTSADGIAGQCPFLRLPRESQELSICCLYYFSAMDSPMLESLASCCLCPDLEPLLLFRIIEVLHCAYKAGYIRMSDHISFFITLLTCLKIYPENIFQVVENNSKTSNRIIYRSLSGVICSYLKQMGDRSVIFHMLEKVIVDQIVQKPPLDNICALLRILITLDPRPSGKLSEESTTSLSNMLAGYMFDVLFNIPEQEDEDSAVSLRIRERRYYCLPCFFLFEKSHTMMKHTLNMLASLVNENKLSDCSSTISAIVSVFIFMRSDAKVQRMMTSCKPEIDLVLEKIILLQASEGNNLTFEKRHKIQCATDRLKIVRSTLDDKC